jgi:hypothetical protein
MIYQYVATKITVSLSLYQSQEAPNAPKDWPDYTAFDSETFRKAINAVPIQIIIRKKVVVVDGKDCDDGRENPCILLAYADDWKGLSFTLEEDKGKIRQDVFNIGLVVDGLFGEHSNADVLFESLIGQGFTTYEHLCGEMLPVARKKQCFGGKTPLRPQSEASSASTNSAGAEESEAN